MNILCNVYIWLAFANNFQFSSIVSKLWIQIARSDNVFLRDKIILGVEIQPPGNMAISSSRERNGIITMTSVQSHKLTYEEMPTVAKRTKKKKKKMEEIKNEREEDVKEKEMKYLRHIHDEISSPKMTKKLHEHYAEKSIQHAKKRLVETVRAKEKRTFFDKDLINNFTAVENSKIGNKSVKKLKSEYFDKYLIRLSSFAIKKMIQTELNNSLKRIDPEKKKKGKLIH